MLTIHLKLKVTIGDFEYSVLKVESPKTINYGEFIISFAKKLFRSRNRANFLGNTLSVLKLTELQYRRRLPKTETTIPYHIGLHRASDQNA